MKRKEYQIGIALAAVLFAASVPVGVSAAEIQTEEPVLCGSCALEMTDGVCTNIAGHADGALVFEAAKLSYDPDSQSSGVQAYEIGNAGQLAWFVREWNAGTLVTADAFLTDDIDWTNVADLGVSWQPIGTWIEGVADTPYMGIFNGNGYEISGLTFTDMENAVPMTVFGNIGSSAIVKELGLTDVSVSSDAAEIAVLALKNQGQIADCYINDTTILAQTEGAVVSDIAAVNTEYATIINCYAAVTVEAGMKPDNSGKVTLSVHPICGENLNWSNPDAISNSYYLKTEDETFNAMVSVVSENGIKGETAAVFESGSVAWKLNKGRTACVFGQTLGEYEALPGFFRDESEFDENGIWEEKLLHKPVHEVILDYTDLEDAYYYVNDTFYYTSLPADTHWQANGMDVAADLEVTSDMVLVQVVPVCPHPSSTPRDTVPATCTVPGTREYVCDSCGAVIGTEEIRAEHVWGAFVYDNNASCIANGTQTRYCDYGCGVFETVVVEGTQLSHSFTNYAFNGNATCAANGTETAYCDYNCGASDTREAAGTQMQHSYTNYISNGNATCQSNGTETAACDYGCGMTDTHEVEGTKTDHSFTNYSFNGDATCTADGTKSALCDYGCGAVDTQAEPGSMLAHSHTNYISNGDATCTADGTKSALCDYGCGAVDTQADPGSMISHSFTAYVSNNDATCMADGTETAYCDYACTNTDTRIAEGSMLSHQWGEYIYNNDATCSANGTETAACMNNCGTNDIREAAGTQLTHSFTNYVYDSNATCSANGTETAYCDYGCGTSDTRESAGTQLIHSFTVYAYNNDATCQANGTETAACDHGCGETDTREKDGTKTDHIFTNYVNNNNATCLADGTETAECDYASCTETDERIIENSKVPHSFTEYFSNHDATCTADGTKTASCDYSCGTEDTQADAGSMIAHSFTAYISNNDATCQADGTETASCDYQCGNTDTRTADGSRLDHSFTAYSYNNDASCLADGTETAYCDYGCHETDSRSVEGSKMDHKYDVYVYNNDASCTANGTETASCAYSCGTTDSREKEGTKLTHSYTVYTYNEDATCENDGTETAACDHGCGESDTRTKAGTKTDHVYGEYIYNNNAGCLKNGTETAMCVFGCGESDVREAEGTMIPHKFDLYVYNEDATCQIEGTETAVCAYGCNTTDTRTVTEEPKTVPHKYEEYKYNDDATCEANGSETAYCIYDCGTTDTREKEGTKKEHTFANGTCTGCGASDDTWIADDVKATAAEDGQGTDGWYRGSVTLNAPDGCYINTKNTEDFGTETSVTVELTNGMNNIKYYLRRNGGKIVERMMQIKADLTAPTGSAAVGSFTSSQAITDLTFEKYFNTAQIVRILGQDGQSGMKSVEYFVADKELSADEIDTAVWGTWNTSDPVKLEKEGRYVIYAKLTDKAGNTAVINTNGMILDLTAPKIEGVAAGSNVCPETKVTVTDSAEMTVTLDNTAVELIDGTLILSTPGAHTLKVVDKAGNQTVVVFSVKADHVWDAGQIQKPASCMEPGLRLDTCTVCTKTREEEIPEEAHVYTNYVYNEDATCQADGTKTALCDFGCQTKDTVTAEGTKTDHKFSNYVYNNDATCQKDGTKTASCDFGCNTVYTAAAEGTKTTHKFTNYVYNQDATCLANGTKTALCDYGCNAIDTVTAEGSMTGHKFTNYVYNNDATCKADGTKTANCDHGCDTKDTITAAGTKLAHTYGTDHICVICKTVDPATQPSTAPSGEAPILGIEDFGGMWGILLITAGAMLLVILGVVVAAGHRRR